MDKKYKLSLSAIIVIIVLLLSLALGYLIYIHNINKNSAEVIIDDNLSINYLIGKNFKFRDSEKEIPFSLINDSDLETMFHINLYNVETESKKTTYDLYENGKKIISNSELENNTSGTISSFIGIKANETKSYKLIIHNPEKKKITLELNVEKSSIEDKNFAQVILNDNLVNKESKTTIGEEISTIDEGLILDIDDNGNTYYFRGNVVNNYVKFADKMWRIIRINGNGTIRLILDTDVTGSAIYDDESSGSRLATLKNLSNTKMYIVLENWYNENLKKYDDYIASDRFCIDTSKEGENLSNYFRINLSNSPTFNCLATKNNSKIGLITIDEIIYAGATVNEPNNYFYLYNSDIVSSSWTLSPFKDAVEGLYYYELAQNGAILTNSTGESSKSLRPVINLKKDIEVEGNGTKDEPYILK